MKKVLLVVGLLSIVGIAKAENVDVDLGKFSLTLPFQEVSAGYLLSLEGGTAESLGGIETLLIGYDGSKYKLSVGAAGNVGPGFPYLSLKTKLSDKFFEPSDLYFGVFYGKNFDTEQEYYGLSCNALIW